MNFLKFSSAQAWPANTVRPPVLQAHRGFWSAGFPENTVPAFRAARTAGFQMSELDVRVSRDGVAVVFHDRGLRRMASSSRLVSDCTADELKKLTNAPTLKEVLNDAAGTDFYNVELKVDLTDTARVESVIIETVRACKAEERVMFSCFNPLSVAYLSQKAPEIPRALLASPQKEPGNHVLLRHLAFAPVLNFQVLNLDQMMLTPENLEILRHREIPFAVWTVNDLDRAKSLVHSGAISVITDRITPEMWARESSQA